MNTHQGETERAVARGIERQKRSEHASTGMFGFVFVLVIAVEIAAMVLTHISGLGWILAGFVVAIIAAGVASEQKKRSALNR